MPATRLGVVIVSWNTAQLLVDCLHSLAEGLAGMEAEVVVVDNASSDGSPERVAREFPAVRLIRNTENVGFARANNQGIASFGAEETPAFFLLLNSDAVAKPGALRELVRFLEQHAEAGAAGPRLVRPDGQPQPFGFGADPTLPYLVARGVKAFLWHRPMHEWSTSRVQGVDWVSGACLLVRREAIAQAGPLDERYFMYFEDNDWCLRIRQAGWQVLYDPLVEVVHLGGQSLAKNPRAQMAYDRSLRRFYAKHYSRVAQLLLKLLLKVYRPVASV